MKNNKVDLKVHRKKGVRVRVFWILFFCLLLVPATLAILIWPNRYDLLEDRMREVLRKNGIEAEFDIEKATTTETIINNISIIKDSVSVGRVGRLELKYRLKQALEGRFSEIILIRPQLDLEVDAQGKILNIWMRNPEAIDQGFAIPKGGIEIRQGKIELVSPYVTGRFDLDGRITSTARWNAELSTNNAVLIRDSQTADIRFSGVFAAKDAHYFTASGKLETTARDSEFSSRTGFDLVFGRQRVGAALYMDGGVTSTLSNVNFGGAQIQSLYAKAGISANLDPASFLPDQLQATWTIKGQEIVLESGRQKKLVSTLIPQKALEQTPIAQHFLPGLVAKANGLFRKFDLAGSGTYQHSDTGYVINLGAPLEIRSKGQNVLIYPGADTPELVFDNTADTLNIQTDIDWKTDWTLYWRNLELLAASENGVELTGVHAFSARIKSVGVWQAQTDKVQNRLSPFNIELAYKNTGAKRVVTASGAIDFDGRLPGGTVRHLRAKGNVKADLPGSDLYISFHPAGNIRLDRFTSTSGWSGQNLDFIFKTGEPFYARVSGQRKIHTQLHDFSGLVSGPEEMRRISLSAEDIGIVADLSAEPKLWDIDVKSAHWKSGNFPVPGTEMQIARATLQVFQHDGQPLDFLLFSEDVRVDTNIMRARDVSIAMSGVPFDFTTDYTAAKVRFTTGTVPVLPIRGTARIANGILTGQATSTLPEHENTSIEINYRFESGLGTGRVYIPEIRFEPRGLQPQYLLPVLTGRVAEVTGMSEVDFDFTFGQGRRIQARGKITLKDMDIGTLLGPFSGVNAVLDFSSLFPLKTRGAQNATVAGFDPGVPLENGRIRFEIIDGGVRIDEAVWPVTNENGEIGRIYTDPVLWQFGDVENRLILHIDNLSLDTLLAGMNRKNFSATGQISGTLPVRVRGVNVSVEDGVLAVRDGGVIRYKTKTTDTASGNDETMGSVFKALENFTYKELEARFDGPFDGEMSLRLQFDGSNEEVLGGKPFEFNIRINGELANIIRNSMKVLGTKQTLQRRIELLHENGG